MATYVLVYQGGSMPDDPGDQAKAMQAWAEWFGGLGEDLVDGGNPFGPSKSVSASGQVGASSTGLSGYTIIKAADLDAAVELAKSCPVLHGGASIDVYETVDVMAAAGAGA